MTITPVEVSHKPQSGWCSQNFKRTDKRMSKWVVEKNSATRDPEGTLSAGSALFNPLSHPGAQGLPSLT